MYYDAPDLLLCDREDLWSYAPSEHPLMLCRTPSHASVDTILPPNRKGIRRYIEEIAEGLMHKKKEKHSSTQDHKNAVDMTLDPKAWLKTKAAKHGRKAAPPSPTSSQRSEEEKVLATSDKFHCGPFSSPTFSGHKTDPSIDVPLFEEEESSLPIRAFAPKNLAECEDTDHPPPIPKIGINDVQLDILASESDVTIWDGLQATHHVYKCRLFLRCVTHPYDTVVFLDIRRVEMECITRPAGSPYARSPALQASYQGAAPDFIINSGELHPKVNLAEGIHMDRVWRKIRNDDGTWGWYRDAFVPLSPRLFDEMDYREFKLVGRVWVGQSCMENELMFGISMLLRGLDMK